MHRNSRNVARVLPRRLSRRCREWANAMHAIMKHDALRVHRYLTQLRARAVIFYRGGSAPSGNEPKPRTHCTELLAYATLENANKCIMGNRAPPRCTIDASNGCQRKMSMSVSLCSNAPCGLRRLACIPKLLASESGDPSR